MHYLCIVYAQEAAAAPAQIDPNTIKDHFIEMDHKHSSPDSWSSRARCRVPKRR